MEGTRVTIDATMLAPAVSVDARFEADVRTVVVADDRARPVAEELRLWVWIILRIPVRVRFEMQLFEPVRRIAAGASRRDC